VTLRLYLDEDVHIRLAGLLEVEGFDVVTALEAGRAHGRIPDEEQLAYAASLGRAICTYNVSDYPDLAVKWADAGRDHAGIVLMRRRSLREMVARFLSLNTRYPDGMANICDYL
jgi:hypothetical protein